MEAKQTTEREQQEMDTEQTGKAEWSGEAILGEKNNASDNTTGENVPSEKRKILECVWTFFLQRPIAVITSVGILLGGIGTLFIGIDAIRPDNSNLSLKGKDIVKFIQSVKSEDREQFDESLRKVEQDPKASVMNKAIAEAYRLKQIGKIDDSIEKWRSIANTSEGIDNDLAAGAWFSIGYLYLEEGEEEKALSAYDKSISLKSDVAGAYTNRGAAKSRLGKYGDAIEDHDEAIRLDPDFADAYTSRGAAKGSLGQVEAAKKDFQTALKFAEQGNEKLKTSIERMIQKLKDKE